MREFQVLAHLRDEMRLFLERELLESGALVVQESSVGRRKSSAVS